MARKSKKLKRAIALLLVAVIILAIVAVGVFLLYKFKPEIFNKLFPDYNIETDSGTETNPDQGGETDPDPKPDPNPDQGGEIVDTGDISFHFMMMGNKYAGDAVYIKAGNNDILIDAGSRESSAPTLKTYMDKYVTDGKLEYVIATHADRDHISGFAASNGIFDMYECLTIIDFPLTNKNTKTLQKYREKRDAEVAQGAVHYSALECYKEQNGAKRIYNLTDDGNVKMEVLYNYYYENTIGDENEYSVCLMFHHGTRQFLFTGDLEGHGEKELIKYNNLSQVELYKAGHHGSKTSTTPELMSKIKPKICVVTCVAGTDEYTQNVPNQFPTQDFINHIAPYTNRVYVTTLGDPDFTNGADYVAMNGNVVVSSEAGKEVTVTCSNNSTLLKDTDWFKAKRETPLPWVS